MLITAWVLAIFFGLFALWTTVQYCFGSINKYQAFMWFLSVIVTAVALGIIYGGLFENSI